MWEGHYLNAKDFGAVGDGIFDDTKAIQDAINTALERKINSVFLPSGTYMISKPLLLKTDWRRSHFWGADGVKLSGENIYNTVIKKTGDFVYTGINTAVDNINAVVIMHDNNNEERVGGSGASLENLRITHTSKNQNSYCVYGKWAVQKMSIKNIMNENLYGQGMYFEENVYSSTFENIVNRVHKNALHVKGGSSNYYRMIFSPNCKDPYVFRGGYSQVDVVYGDDCTGTVFTIGGDGTAMCSIGTESPHAEYIVSVDKNSHVNIDSLTIHRQVGSDEIDCDETAIFTGSGAVNCDILRVLNIDSVPNGKTGYLQNSKTTAAESSFNVKNIYYYGTSINNPKLKHSKKNSNPVYTGSYSHSGSNAMVRRNNIMPYIGMNFNEEVFDTPYINKAIYLDNETKYIDSLGNNNAFQKPYNSGDILLINKPKEMNILGYVVTEKGNAIDDCKYAEIPIVVSGTSEERPNTNLYIGFQYFDTSLGKPIWCSSIRGGWVDANGNAV